jgi:hypothetical protein
MRQIPTSFKFLLLTGCIMFSLMYSNRSVEDNDVASLRRENDSLRMLVASTQHAVSALHAASVWTDSIFQNLELTTPVKPSHLSNHLRDVHFAVVENQKKMVAMEHAVRVARNHNEGYLSIVGALQGEVADRVDESDELADSIDYYEDVSVDLFRSVKLQEEAMNSLYQELQDREARLESLERKAHSLRMATEGEVYYVKGQQAEETAKRIRLAPQKKKETYREALELYKKSYSLGKHEAFARISSIEKLLSMPSSNLVTDAGSPPGTELP